MGKITDRRGRPWHKNSDTEWEQDNGNRVFLSQRPGYWIVTIEVGEQFFQERASTKELATNMAMDWMRNHGKTNSTIGMKK